MVSVGSNLKSLLEVCNFEEVRFLRLPPPERNLKQALGALARFSFIRWNALKHRLFGVNQGGQFDTELILSARRLQRPTIVR